MTVATTGGCEAMPRTSRHSRAHPDAPRHCEQSEAIQTKPLTRVSVSTASAGRKVFEEAEKAAHPMDLGSNRVGEPFRCPHQNGRPQRANQAAVRGHLRATA